MGGIVATSFVRRTGAVIDRRLVEEEEEAPEIPPFAYPQLLGASSRCIHGGQIPS